MILTLKIKERLKRNKDYNKTEANSNSIFNLVNYDINVPINGFYKYCLDIWKNILNDKDLNISMTKRNVSSI